MSFLPLADRKYLNNSGIVYEETEEGGRKALIIKGYELPPDRYDVASADILIILPAGYPDVAPDMFHAMPWLRLTDGNKYPIKADQPVSFAGQNWQRWSRHNNSWRSGVDGIWTMLKRVEHALESAA